jgi:CPA2 family monovalent cation:H+ antiporter-2
MIDPLFFIQDLAVILISATLGGYCARLLGLSPVVGYIAAGLIVGTPAIAFPYVHDGERIALIAQLGVVFLMFSIGLRFRLDRLRELGLPVVLATVLTALVIFITIRVVAGWWGLPTAAAVALAAIFMNSSSAIISKLIEERGIGHERYGQLAMGMTLLEDIVAVIMLTVLGSYLLVEQGGDARPIMSMLGLLSGFALLVFVGGLLLLPKVFAYLSRGKGSEALSICVAGLLFSIALVSVWAGYSIALGAFLFGVVVAETTYRPSIERTFQGFKDIFLTLFFVTIGMFVDVTLLPGALGWILFGVLVALCLRSAAAFVSLFLCGEHPRNALRTAFCVTPLGEFSFIIAGVAIGGGLFGENFQAIVVGVVLGTSLLSPILIGRGDRLSAFLEVGRWPLLERWHLFCRSIMLNRSSATQSPKLWVLLRKRIIQIVVELVIVLTVVVFAWKWYQALSQAFDGVSEKQWLTPVFWVFLGLICLLPLVAIWRNFAAVTLIIGDYLHQVSGMKSSKCLRIGLFLRVVFALSLALTLWLLLPEELPKGWMALLVLPILGLAMGFLWREFIRIHSVMESDFEHQLSETKRTSSRMLFDDWRRGNWDFNIRECIVPDNSIVAGQTLEAIALRKKTGCSVVGIERQGLRLARVGPRTQIFPGDEILLLGSDEAIAQAEALLQRWAPVGAPASHIEDLVLKRLLIPAESALHGKTLGECHWSRDFDVQVVAIRRDNLTLNGLDSKTQLLSGDEVLLLATERSMERLASSSLLDLPAS